MRTLKAHEDMKDQNEKLSHSSTSLLLLKMWGENWMAPLSPRLMEDHFPMKLKWPRKVRTLNLRFVGWCGLKEYPASSQKIETN
jgi:hypothetical protein